MRSLLYVSLPALWIVPAVQPAAPAHAAWQWQRAIVPNAASPAAEQCAVLDADLFARAAPGLRDVRLLQDGREIAYATDISYDDRGGHAVPSAADRALYEVALAVPARPGDPAAPASNPNEASGPQHAPGSFYGQGLLPAHVPVERIRLDPSSGGTEFLSLRAAAADGPANPETLQAALTPGHPAAAFTIGANLQKAADVRLALHGDATAVSSFVLEMRRRELCYQPLSSSPLLLFFGNPKAPLVHYDYAANYQPSVAPLLASMGRTELNPGYRAPTSAPRAFSTRAKLALALLACGLALVLTLQHVRGRR